MMEVGRERWMVEIKRTEADIYYGHPFTAPILYGTLMAYNAC